MAMTPDEMDRSVRMWLDFSRRYPTAVPLPVVYAMKRYVNGEPSQADVDLFLAWREEAVTNP